MVYSSGFTKQQSSLDMDEDDPLQVDRSIHKKVTEWFKKNKKPSSNKKPSGKKKAEASQKSNESNYWAEGNKTRWSETEIRQYFHDSGFLNANTQKKNGKIVVMIDKKKLPSTSHLDTPQPDRSRR